MRLEFRKIQYNVSISRNAPTKPMRGDVRLGMSTLLTIPSRFNAPTPAATMVAPNSPPTSACELELGTAYHHVIRSQAIAPRSAAMTMAWVVVSSLTRPAPIVLATAVPANAPMKLNAAAMRTAVRGLSARVATEVAMAFAVSWKPLM